MRRTCVISLIRYSTSWHNVLTTSSVSSTPTVSAATLIFSLEMSVELGTGGADMPTGQSELIELNFFSSPNEWLGQG